MALRWFASSGSTLMSAISWICLLFSTMALCSEGRGPPASTLIS